MYNGGYVKKFTVAGVSMHNDQIKLRFCSDRILRIKNLQKQGDSDINLVDLPQEMTKEEACEYLLTLPSFSNYRYDIKEVMDQKKLKSNKDQPIISSPKIEEDAEINSIKELAIA